MRVKTLIQSVDRAIEILEIVRDAEGPVRAAMIAHEMGLPLKTAHNLIRSLLQHGYLVQNEEKSYQLGPECFLLSDQAKGPFSQLGRQVGDAVLELHRKSGIAAFFGCDYAYRLYCVAIVEASGYREINGRQVWLNSMHATAAGRVILAARGTAYLEKFLEQSELRKFNSQTKNTPDELRAEVEKVRRDGYSIVEDEHVVGFISVAIPVTTPQGKLLGAIGSSCRTHLWHERNLQLEDVLRDLRWTAGKIVESCGNLF